MTSITPEIRAEVLELHQKNPQRFSPFRVARRVGVSVATVLEITGSIPEPVRAESAARRPELTKYLVAKRRTHGEPWNNKSPELRKARADYEAGLVELCTGRDGAYLMLYAIPRVVPQPRPGYFSAGDR